MGHYTELSLIKLGFMFQEEQYPSTPAIMKRLQVSSRTTHRYIDDLKEIYQAPIYYDHTHKTYCCIKWDFNKELKKKLRTRTI